MKEKVFILVIVSTLFATGVQGQISSSSKNKLRQDQDSLKKLSFQMVNGDLSEDRQKATDQFIPTLVNALKVKYSYSFPFDSLQQVSILYDRDSTFRIFSWAIALSDVQYRFYGALQKNTPDGSLALIPFFDNTSYIKNTDTITGPKAWIGALYYNMVKTTYKDKDFYTLMGWCGYGFRTNEKVLDVLTFQNGQPVFGAPVFRIPEDSSGVKNRFFLKYKRDGGAGLNFDRNLEMIVYDHLAPLNGNPEDTASLVPDGTYSGFKWKNGNWVHVEKVFHDTEEETPVPQPFEFNKTIEGNKSRQN